MKISDLTKPEIDLFDLFNEQLLQDKIEQRIKVLNRGYDIVFAYRQFNLDVKLNSMDIFAKRLFYYGDKARFVWTEQRARPYEINEISDNVFSLIFEEFYKIGVTVAERPNTNQFIAKNNSEFSFFRDKNNLDKFIKTKNTFSDPAKLQIRNYYFSIIHQLNETPFNDTSVLISATTNEITSNNFSKRGSGIKIFFWQPNIQNSSLNFKDLPVFTGKPYKRQAEISVFAVIFPHYIYKFTHQGETYLNPAIFKLSDFEIAMFTGLPVDNEDIDTKKNDETIYKSIVTDNPDGSLFTN